MEAIASYFKFAERGTDFWTEVKAGVATFMVMVYIVAVNPGILSAALPPGSDVPAFLAAAAAATALVAAVMTIAMGLFANYPIAIAAGLGINGIVAFGLAIGSGLGLAGAMGVIVWEGIVVTVLVVVGLREAIMNAVPLALKRAIGVGIGLFILFIGFVDGGLIVRPDSGPVPVAFVYPNNWATWLTLIGLAITVVLYVRKVPAALVLSIIITSIIALLVGVTTVPADLIKAPDFSTLGQFDLGAVFKGTDVGGLGLLAGILIVFTLMLADFFDTMGTATAITEQAGLTTA